MEDNIVGGKLFSISTKNLILFNYSPNKKYYHYMLKSLHPHPSHLPNISPPL